MISRRKCSLITSLFIYCAIAYYYFGVHILGYLNRQVGIGSDPVSYLWFMHWYTFAFKNHLNPFISHVIYVPTGYNLTRATSIFGVYLLSIPLQLFTSTLTAYNLIAIFTTALSAWTLFLLCEYLTQAFLPSLVAGYLFGFSAYMLGQMVGHINLTSGVFLIPLIVWLVLLFLDRKIKTWIFMIAMLICLILLFYISLEIFATFTVCGTFALCLSYTMFSSQRPRFNHLVVRLFFVYLLLVLLVSPFLYYFFVGHVQSPIPSGRVLEVYSNDLLSFIIPTQQFHFRNHGTDKLASLFSFRGNYAEEGGYLGFIIIIWLLFIFQRKHKKQVIYITILALIFMLISLGPVLHIAGVKVFHILPTWLFYKIPFITAALPVRYMLYFSMITAIMVAIWLKEVKSFRGRILKYFLAVLAIIALFPAVQSQYRTVYNILPSPSSFFSFGDLLSRKDIVLFLSSKYNYASVKSKEGRGFNFSSATLDQLQCNFCFLLSGGHLGAPPNGFANPYPKMGFSAFKNLIKIRGITVILLMPQSYKRWQPLLKQLGVTPKYVGGFWVYRLS